MKEEKSSKFVWAQGKVLTQKDFEIEDKVAYIEDFIFSRSVTLIYSPPKQGKTWLAYGMANKIASDADIDEIYYLDMDNSVSTLKDRKVDELLIVHQKIHYLTRGTIGCDPLEQLGAIASAAVREAYAGVAFFLDTTKDFVDTDSKTQATEFMKHCVRIRDAGGTVIILHHATKNERRISGSQAFINTPDNVYSMKQTGELNGIINYLLTVTHARGLVKDCKWSVDTQTLELMEYDPVSSGMSKEDKQAVEAGILALKNAPEGLSMSKMILGMGYSVPSDRNGKRLVRELTGKYWRVDEKSRNNHIYHLLEEQA